MSSTVNSDGVTVSTSTDSYGNTYTTSVSAEGLDSEDFITLMLTELQNQDPTDPEDASEMLDSQLQLSTLEANTATIEAMESLTSSYEQTALASAASLIGSVVENGDTDDDGNAKEWEVSAVESSDGSIYLTAYQITGYYSTYTFDSTDSVSNEIGSTDEDDTFTVTDSDGEEYTISTYGLTYEEFAEQLNAISGVTADMVDNGDGTYSLEMYVENGSSSISSSGTLSLAYTTGTYTSYDDEADTLVYSDITKIY